MKKLQIFVLVMLLLTFTFAMLTSCGKDGDDGEDTLGSESITDSQSETTDPESTTDTAPESVIDTEPQFETEPVSETESISETDSESETTKETETEMNQPELDFSTFNDLEKLTTPFWKSNVMHNESISFIARSNGTVTARLLFKPTKIISLKSNGLTVEYEEGKDYTWDGVSKTLYLTNKSAIPFFTQNDMKGLKEDGTPLDSYPAWDDLERCRYGAAMYCVGAYLYEKQVAITYEYEAGSWTGPVTEYQGNNLPLTMAKLQAGEPLNITFWGDSIFTGCDSSAMWDRAPYQESFPVLIEQVLEAKYGSTIEVKNPSVGGKSATWGLSDVDDVISTNPDLVFIGFGMNDALKTGEEEAQLISDIMAAIKAAHPNCEFIIVSPMVPNAESGSLGNQGQFATTYAELAGEGVGFVEMFNFHSKVLRSKDFIATSGNNVNHPNDWMIRCYTMNMLSCLIDY